MAIYMLAIGPDWPSKGKIDTSGNTAEWKVINVAMQHYKFSEK